MTDKNTCWYQQNVVNEMNAFFDKHIRNDQVMQHMSVFTALLERVDDQVGNELLDLGTGTGMLSEFCRNYKFYGADMPHVIAGCAMRNYPQYFYKACDIVKDDLKWINRFPIIVINAVIDIMQSPLDIFYKVLDNAKKYVLIHRQEIISEENLSFGNWENGGNSFLLRRKTSWSINGLDHKLYKFLDKKNGFFIEAGANDGVTQSNTLFFEYYYDWKGILIEPIECYYNQCKSNRSTKNIFVNAALVDNDCENIIVGLLYSEESNGLLGVVNDSDAGNNLEKMYGQDIRYCTVPAKTLNDILEEHEDQLPSVIDLLILDVEGYEKQALQGLDLSKWNITYILAEELDNRKDNIKSFLGSLYEEVAKLSEHDYLYKRKI